MKFLIILTIGLGLLALFRPELIKDFLSFVKESIYTWGNYNYIIVFITSLIESFPVLGVVIPGQNILLIVGGFFAEQSYQHLIYVTIIVFIGAVLGNYIGYFLGKYYGEDFFKQYGLWFGIGETEVKYLKKSIKKWGMWGIIFGKFHNLTRAFIPFIAGTMGMKSNKFMFYNLIGSLLWAIVMIVLGVIFAKTYEIIVDYLFYIMIAIMFLGGVYIWKFKKQQFMKYMHEKNKEIESKYK